MKIDFKENIRLTIAFILLIAVFLWICNKEKWRSKKEPQQTPPKGIYANFMSRDSVSCPRMLQYEFIKKIMTKHVKRGDLVVVKGAYLFNSEYKFKKVLNQWKVIICKTLY